MRKFIIAGVLVLFGLLVYGYFLSVSVSTPSEQVDLDPLLQGREITEVLIGSEEFDLVIARTSSERVQGLSRTKYLAENTGMLFIFENSGRHGIWMKDMNYPIDIIWLGDDNKIVSIEENATPESYPEVFSPTERAKYVIEISDGEVERLGLEQGDFIGINLTK